MSALIDPARSNGPLNVVIAGSAPGSRGVGIASAVASVDGKSVVLTLTDGTTQAVPLPPGSPGPKGVGVSSAIVSRDGKTLVLTLTDGSQSDVPLTGVIDSATAAVLQQAQGVGVTDAIVTAYLFGLPTTDKNQPGTCFNNAGIITVSAAGVGQPVLVVGGIRPSALNWWFNNLPDMDPNTPGAWFANAGIPTLSAAGFPASITAQGDLTDALWCEFIAGLAQPNGAIPTETTGLWLNNAGIATRN